MRVKFELRRQFFRRAKFAIRGIENLSLRFWLKGVMEKCDGCFLVYRFQVSLFSLFGWKKGIMGWGEYKILDEILSWFEPYHTTIIIIIIALQYCLNFDFDFWLNSTLKLVRSFLMWNYFDWKRNKTSL